MKFIEYKPDIQIVIDVSNIPDNMSVEECLQMLKLQPLTYRKKLNAVEIDNTKPWVHPDYIVKEKSNSYDGKSIDHSWWPFPDPEGQNETKKEIWECAKPKINKGLKGQFRQPIVFGTSPHSARGKSTDNLFWGQDPLGAETFSMEAWKEAMPKKVLNWVPKEDQFIFGVDSYDDDKIPQPVIFGTQEDKDRADFYNRHQEYSFETHDLYLLSKSSEQLKDWLKRKKKRPILTAQDFLWIDNMVDEVFEKHTRNLKKENFSYHSERFPFTISDKHLYAF